MFGKAKVDRGHEHNLNCDVRFWVL